MITKEERNNSIEEIYSKLFSYGIHCTSFTEQRNYLMISLLCLTGLSLKELLAFPNTKLEDYSFPSIFHRRLLRYREILLKKIPYSIYLFPAMRPLKGQKIDRQIFWTIFKEFCHHAGVVDFNGSPINIRIIQRETRRMIDNSFSIGDLMNASLKNDESEAVFPISVSSVFKADDFLSYDGIDSIRLSYNKWHPRS